MANIYISHTNKDRELATRIAAGLREAGQKVFIDFAEFDSRRRVAQCLGQCFGAGGHNTRLDHP
jgi:hypothetical protein